jgi:hypothetical protein
MNLVVPQIIFSDPLPPVLGKGLDEVILTTVAEYSFFASGTM